MAREERPSAVEESALTIALIRAQTTECKLRDLSNYLAVGKGLGGEPAGLREVLVVGHLSDRPHSSGHTGSRIYPAIPTNIAAEARQRSARTDPARSRFVRGDQNRCSANERAEPFPIRTRDVEWRCPDGLLVADDVFEDVCLWLVQGRTAAAVYRSWARRGCRVRSRGLCVDGNRPADRESEDVHH